MVAKFALRGVPGLVALLAALASGQQIQSGTQAVGESVVLCCRRFYSFFILTGN